MFHKKRSMVVSKLQGGLANQIFQWAHGYSLSLEYNTPLYLDLSYYKNQTNVTKRSFSLDKFSNLKYSIFSNFENKNYRHITDNFHFKKLHIDEKVDYYLDGYWQSEKYFNINSEKIIENLLYTDSQKKELFSKFPQLESNSLSIHIRRTDYLSSNGFHPVCPISYYENAINLIGGYDYIFVFSDDINWCKNNLIFENIIFVENQNDLEDLYTMSLCKNNIIANSSFSWWGAYLNLNSNKKIICPSNWFGSHTGINTTDIYPNKWIKL